MEITNTQVHIFRPSTPFVHLVVTPFSEAVTYVFTVDLFTGSLLFSSTPCVDVFKSHRQACNFIVSKYNKPSFRLQEWQGKGLIGITIENHHLVIGLVEGARKCGSLPNGSVIKQITSTNFVTIPLKTGNENSKVYVKNFPIDKMHFFCETMDLTRPYPSEHFVDDYDESFCWNQRWRLPFARFGVEFVCIVLLQGYAKTSSCSPFVTYIIRRSVLNPYTRYTSRGTDGDGSPGNEAECELIFFNENDKNQKFAANCWRRGSIPMMWKTVVGAVGSGQHIISQEQRNVTSVYFEKVSQRFQNIPVTVISLLNDSESELNEAYKEAVKPLNFVRFFSFDILKVPENQRIEQFQAFLKPIVAKEDCFTIGDKNGIVKKQKMIFRFNCVDSTDRTNIATFVYGRILTEIKLGPLSNEQKLHKVFLAYAFIEGGDVISLLYTSTEAALTKSIRDTVENMSQAKRDTSLACIRRVKHIYGNDNLTDKVIESWISKGGILNANPYFSLDYFYLSLIQNSSMNFRKINLVDPSVVSFELTSTKVNSVDGSFELIIQLPMPMVIGVIRLLFLPSSFGDIPKSFTLSCGMNANEKNIYLKDVMIPDVKEPTIVKYSLYHAYRWGIQAPLEQKACEPARFIFITYKQCTKTFPASTASMGLLSFNVDKNSRLNNESKNQTDNNNQNASNQQNPYLSMNYNHNKTSRFSSNNASLCQPNPKIAIGNVLIDACIPSMVSKIPSFDNESTEIVNKYKKEIESFLSQPNDSMLKSKSIDCYIKLELFRIKNKIPLYIRNRILIEKGINPIITSIRHYIHRINDHSLCNFCHEKLDANNNLFAFHEQFKSLLIPLKNIPNCNQKVFLLCKKCREKIEKYKNELEEVDSMVIKKEPPCFSLRHWKIGEIKEQVCLSRKPLATFLEFPKSSSENDNDIDKLLFSDDEEEIEETNEVKEMTPKSESKPNLFCQKRSSACRNSLRTRITPIKISNYNSCIAADVIQCNDIISRSIDIDINNDTFTYISNQSDDDVINYETNKTIVVEEKNDDSSQQFIKKVDSIPCFKDEDSIDEDKSKIKYVIDSSTQKEFTFTLCLSSFSVPNELVITFEGNLPEKVEVIAFKNNANTATSVIPRSISTTAKASMISPSSSAVATPPRSSIKSPQFDAELQKSIQQSNYPSTPKRARVSILENNNNNNKEQNFRNAHLSLPPTSASISELNPRKNASIMIKHDDKIFVQFDPIQTSSLTFVICAEEDQEEIIMKHVKVLGNFIEKPHPNPSWYSFPVPQFKGNKIIGSWNPETQTHTYVFKNQSILRRVNFKVPYNTNGLNCVTKNQGSSAAVPSTINASNCDKKLNPTGGIGSNKSCGNITGLLGGSQSYCYAEQTPQSVFLALYNEKGKLEKNFHILIPQPLPPVAPTNCKEVEMNFQIADSPVFSIIKLFYLDQIDKLKPFEVSFYASPVENEK